MSAETIPDETMKAAAEAHADFARSSVKDNLTLIIAKAIHDAVMAERERCAGIARAEHAKRFANEGDYPAARVHDFLVVAASIEKSIRGEG